MFLPLEWSVATLWQSLFAILLSKDLFFVRFSMHVAIYCEAFWPILFHKVILLLLCLTSIEMLMGASSGKPHILLVYFTLLHLSWISFSAATDVITNFVDSLLQGAVAWWRSIHISQKYLWLTLAVPDWAWQIWVLFLLDITFSQSFYWPDI